MSVERPIVGALAVVIRADHVLLVRRRNPPDAGLWGFPGGKIDAGEGWADAAVRELFEETQVVAQAGGVVTCVDVIDRTEQGVLAHHFLLVAVRCLWQGGKPQAGDDALEAAWVPVDAALGGDRLMSEGVTDVLRRALAFG